MTDANEQPDTAIVRADATALADVTGVWSRAMNHPHLLGDGPLTNDEAVDQLMRMEAVKRALTELAQAVGREREAFGLAQVEAHGGSLEGGIVRYYAGVAKESKCLNAAATFMKLLELQDLETVAALLVTQAW